MNRVILASASPRRRELLSSVCDSFEIITAPTDESLENGVHPRDAVEILAIRKGRAVLDAKDGISDCIVISSDTLVEMDGIPLGKPRDESEAYSMLSRLSGRGHNVHTGIAIHYKGGCVSGVATTEVRFRELSESEIKAYIDSGDPMDKAGAYGIQSGAGKFVEEISGDFDTVVGFPIRLLRSLLSAIGKEDILC